MSVSKRKVQLNFSFIAFSQEHSDHLLTSEDIPAAWDYTLGTSVIWPKHPERFAIITGGRSGKSDSNRATSI